MSRFTHFRPMMSTSPSSSSSSSLLPADEAQWLVAVNQDLPPLRPAACLPPSGSSLGCFSCPATTIGKENHMTILVGRKVSVGQALEET